METFRKFLSKIPETYFFVVLATINILLIALAYLNYNGKIEFWDFPFSYIGSNYTYFEGNYNNTSAVFYSFSMLLSGLILFFAAIRNSLNSPINQITVKYLLFVSAGIGFVIAAFAPNDTLHSFHVFGSSTLVASLWLMASINLFELRIPLGRSKLIIAQLLLQIPIFAYAGTFFLGFSPLDSILQKFAIISLGMILIYSTAKNNKN